MPKKKDCTRDTCEATAREEARRSIHKAIVKRQKALHQLAYE